MSEPKAPDYWSCLLVQLRKDRGWTQTQLAVEMGVSKDTVSRWENELKYPTIQHQKRIGELATSLNLASISGVSQVVDASPFPMILTDKYDFVIAASKISGFQAGLTVFAQTPVEERESYIQFSQIVTNSGFWTKSGNVFDYVFELCGEERRAVLHSIGSRGHIFALVQKL